MIDILKINGEVKQTVTPNRFIGWREKEGSFEPIGVAVHYGSVVTEGNVETQTITIKTEILTEFHPENI